jgi:hypothetical protein
MALLAIESWFFDLARNFFILLGVLLWLLGGKYLSAWFREKREIHSGDTSVVGVLHPFARFLKGPVPAITAIVCVFALLVWPPDFYVTLIANEATIPGKWWGTLGKSVLYTVFKVSIMAISAFIVLVLSGNPRIGEKINVRRSTLLIILAAFFMAVGIGVIFIAIKQLL